MTPPRPTEPAAAPSPTSNAALPARAGSQPPPEPEAAQGATQQPHSSAAQKSLELARSPVQKATPDANEAASGLDQSAGRNIPDILNDPVTAHMRPMPPALRAEQTVDEALQMLRATPYAGRVVYFYVVDDSRRLQGVVPARKLLLSPVESKIAQIMSSHTVAIPAGSTVLDACEFFTLHKFLAFPVVDADRRIVGAVDIDLYTDEIRELDRRQDSEDLFQLVGMHLTEAAQGNTRAAFLGRFPWLLCNVLGGMLSALIADAYQDVSTLVVVAPFIALVTALAESVSIQSVSLALEALHAQPARWSSFLTKFRRELLVGLLLGVASGLTVGVIAWAWKGNFVVAASLFLGIAGGVLASAGVGLSMPYLLRIFGRDPRLASGPIALALSDVVTLLFYFNLGRWILSPFLPA